MSRRTSFYRMAFVFVLMGLKSPLALAQNDEANYFISRGERIQIELMPDIVAVQGPRSAARTPTGFREGIVAFAEEAVADDQLQKQFTDFSKEDIFFVRSENGQARAVEMNLQRTIGSAISGIAARIRQADRSAVVVVTREFVVRFRDGVTEERIQQLNKEHGTKIVRRSRFDSSEYILAPEDDDPNKTLTLAARFHDLEEVDNLSHPNFVPHRETRSTPNDPLFSNQWHLHNTGQANGKAGADVKALGAWATTKGSPEIVIAVIDPDGAEINHVDLRTNKFINPEEDGDLASDGHDNDNNGFIDDVSGWNFRDNSNNPKRNFPHGTAAAGVAVAKSDNNLGVCGVAPGCRLLAICQGITVQDDADAFRYAALMGADVISNSWGYSIGTPATQVVEEAIEEVATSGRDGKGCVVLFAMTNEKIDNFGGAGGVQDISSHPKVIAIGRSTNKDLWGHSGFGDGMALLAPTQAAKGSREFGLHLQRSCRNARYHHDRPDGHQRLQ